jgi:phage gp36-like protein
MARFLKDTDYKKQIRDWIRNIINYNDSSVQEDCELAAQAEMETYLNSRYDIASIFSTTQPEEDRNRLIVLYLVDITLYHLHSNISPDTIPELRESRYKAAITWCKDVAKGTISPILPEKDIEIPGTVQAFFHGGNDKYNNKDSRF